MPESDLGIDGTVHLCLSQAGIMWRQMVIGLCGFHQQVA